MTIAAGFRYADGVLLCADSEYSHSNLKLPGRKIFGLNFPNRKMDMWVAIAGNVRVACSALRHVERAIRKLPEGSMDETALIVFLEAELEKYHQQHMYKHPLYRYEGGPDFWWIIAAIFRPSNSLCLLSTSEATVEPTADYCAIGSGKEMADYILYPLSRRSLQQRPLRQILLLATHMLYQVKLHVHGCGGTSVFRKVATDGSFCPATFDLLAPLSYSETWQRITEDLFYAAADLDKRDGEVCIGLEMTEKRVKEIRSEQRTEKRRRDMLERRIEKRFKEMANKAAPGSFL